MDRRTQPSFYFSHPCRSPKVLSSAPYHAELLQGTDPSTWLALIYSLGGLANIFGSGTSESYISPTIGVRKKKKRKSI